ncbi:hypothetical protein TNCV_3326731 [Trichonephila clavipes]|nr:hypothetical protein TNCV_3326731 [Trichonephila clavipes]
MGSKVLWAESRVQETGEYISLRLQFQALIVEVEIGGVAIYYPFGIFSNEIVLTHVCCSRLRPTTGVHLTPCQDEFHEPRSDYVREVALETTR